MLWICDVIAIGLIIVYVIWFIITAKTRFPDKPSESSSLTLKNAYFMRKDWIKGAILFDGYRRVILWGSIIFPIMVLFYAAYDSISSERIIIYTCLSLVTSIMEPVIGFTNIAKSFRNAYCIIQTAITKFESNQIKEEELGAAIIQGEEIIKNIK